MLKLLPASGAASAHRYDAILDDTHTNESQCTGKLTHAARQCCRIRQCSGRGDHAAMPSSTPVIANSDMMISKALEPGEEELTCSVFTSLQRPVYS